VSSEPEQKIFLENYVSARTLLKPRDLLYVLILFLPPLSHLSLPSPFIISLSMLIYILPTILF
jgi:hypothetical protein